MIEKYFQTGVRLKWACPATDASGAKDGSIINSPARSPAPMVYDGMDDELFAGFGAPNVATLGLTKGMAIPYAWLVYSLGRTTRRMLSAGDVLTGPMSGCLIAEWTEKGMRWVGHVGTVESSDAINKKVKQNFGIAMPTQARGFYPDSVGVWPTEEIAAKMRKFKTLPKLRIMALVTTAVEFYSILMFELQGGLHDEWCVGGIKKVAPMTAVQVRASLLS